jgi:hypothetical protein
MGTISLTTFSLSYELADILFIARSLLSNYLSNISTLLMEFLIFFYIASDLKSAYLITLAVFSIKDVNIPDYA